MRINDALTGAFLIVFALAEIAYTRSFPRLHGQSYGPDLFPVLIGIGLIICGGVLIARGLAARRTHPMIECGDWVKDGRKLVNLALLIAAMLAYILWSDAIGFIPLSIVILTVLILRLGGSAPLAAGVAVAATLVIHTLFAKLLLVPLPWGLMLPFAW